MDHSLPHQFLNTGILASCWLLVLDLSNSLLLLFIFVDLFIFLHNFLFLTGLSSLLEPSGFWHHVLPVWVCSLVCNNNKMVIGFDYIISTVIVSRLSIC